ncbi:MAG: universal stress protein [Bacteroidales bacterium]
MKIIVPTDLTRAANQAVRQAVVIARKAGFSLTLFHVQEAGPGSETIEKLKEEASLISKVEGVPCDVIVKTGNVLEQIVVMVCEKEYDLVVIGTHGSAGIRQKLFGADILKLVAKIPVPVMVVSEESPLIEEFNRIVLPVGSHDNFNQGVDAVLLLAGIFDVEVHLYSIQKPGFEWPARMLANIDETTRRFTEKGVKLVRKKEDQDDFSQGFARQTIRYARLIGADVLWMMSVASEDYYYMSKTYKESILFNEDHLPVLCAGGGE